MVEVVAHSTSHYDSQTGYQYQVIQNRTQANAENQTGSNTQGVGAALGGFLLVFLRQSYSPVAIYLPSIDTTRLQ